MSPDPEERELEEYLGGRSPLSREYASLGREEPPADLDAGILADAAAAARPKGRARRSALWWLRPAALAATVLLSLSLVLRIGESPAPRRNVSDQAAPAVPVTVLPPRPPSANLPAPALAEPAAKAESENALLAQPPAEATTVTAERQARTLQEAPLAVTAFAKKDMAASAGAVAAPTLSAEAVQRILDEIEARLARGQAPSAADTRLREILALQKSGHADEVAAALTQFARDFPDDPIAALVSAPGQ